MQKEFVIEKNIPIKRQQKSLIYRTDEIPFDKLDVGDSVLVPLSKLIFGNLHPDKRERAKAINAVSSYLKRKFPEKKFIQRIDTDTEFTINKKITYDKICVRFWRVL
jgi:hypothetical protein